MNNFHNISFPLPLAFGASGGPRRNTDIVTLASGHEQRNTAQADSRRRYDAGVGIKRTSDLALLIAFFEARRGQLYGFRFRDPVDHSSANAGVDPSALDQVLGMGDGVQTEFPLIKHYGDSEASWRRRISKPVVETVIVAIDGVTTSGLAVNINDGTIVFDTPPASGAAVTAGFIFDVPARFDTPELTVSLESFAAGGAVSVPLIEIKTHA